MVINMQSQPKPITAKDVPSNNNKKCSENAEQINDNLKPINVYMNDDLDNSEEDEIFSFEAKPINGENGPKKVPSVKNGKEGNGTKSTNLMTKSTNSVEIIDSVCTTDTESEPELELIPRRNRSMVSRVNDETDNWGEEELTNKEEHFLTLKDARLKDALLSRLNTFRRNRELCDVTLFVREHEILAHKVVLASISPALFDMFLSEETSTKNNPMNDASNSAEKEIENRSATPTNNTTNNSSGKSQKNSINNSYYEFEQADYDCFEAIVNFAYTSKLQISNRKVSDLYKTAYALQVFPVANACARYLAEHLNYNNCIGIRKHANFHNDKYLVEKVDNFICENFENIIGESLEFTKLACIKVRIITETLQTDNILIGQYLAEKCIEYFQKYPRNFERIDQQIEALTEKSHLLFLDEDNQLQDCSEMNEQSSVGSCDLVKDYRRLANNKPIKSVGINNNSQLSQHRVTGAMAVKLNASRVSNAKFASNESLNSIASSGSTNHEDEIDSRLICVNKTSSCFWIALAVFNRRLIAFSIQRLNDNTVEHEQNLDKTTRQSAKNSRNPSPIVCANGNTTNNYEASAIPPLDNLNSMSNIINSNSSTEGIIQPRRVPLQAMAQARCSIGATFLNGRIIIFGGYDRGECLKSVEEYDIEEQEWRPLPEMCSERGRFDSAVIGNMVYAIAGSNGNNDLKSCERYDPQNKSWTQIKPLNKPRSHNCCATLDNFIYCIGGSSDQVVLRDCERYDPSKDEWQPIAPMHMPRFQAACTSWRGLIVTCAGCDRWNCLDTVEAYDPQKDSWRQLARLKTPRRGCAVAVIKDSLYVIGGHDGTSSLTSVEVLDHPNIHSWRPGPSLITARANTHAVVTAAQHIYVIGGFNANQFLSTIEVLENEQLGWRSWQIPRNAFNKHTIPEESSETSLDNVISDNEKAENQTKTA